MIFGNLSGYVNGTEKVIFDSEVAGSAVDSITTGNILNGDEDGWYTVILRSIGGAAGWPLIRFNGDTGSNYGHRGIYAESTSTGDDSSTGQTSGRLFAAGSASGETSFIVIRIYAKSGTVRMYEAVGISKVSGTTITDLTPLGGVWNNTADNLVSITINHGAAGGLGVGSRVIVLKSNNFTGGTPTGVITTPYIQGSWVRVGSSILGSNATSVTFSGLDGDRDVVYMLSTQTKTSSVTTNCTCNTDTGTNYGSQYLRASNTTIQGARNTSYDRIAFIEYTSGANAYSMSNTLLFAKQGFVRPAISVLQMDTTGTTVGWCWVEGTVWNNTNTNITQLVITCSGASGLLAGSQFELYALRPNG